MKAFAVKIIVLAALFFVVSNCFSSDLEVKLSTNIVTGAGKEGDTLQLFVTLSNTTHEERTIFFSTYIQKPDGEILYYPDMTSIKPNIYLLIPPAFQAKDFELFRLIFGGDVITEYGEYKITCAIENNIIGSLPVTDTTSFQYIRDDWFVQSEKRYYVEGDMTVGDLNNDNYPDLILNTAVMLNDGKGGFRNPVIYKGGILPYPATIADVDNDSYLDMLVSINLDSVDDKSEILVFLNKGNGTFENYVEYGTGQDSQQVTAVDLNNDGFTDLVICNHKSMDISVLINKGDGTFEREVRYSLGNRTNSISDRVEVADMNNDGFVDLIVGNSLDNGDDKISQLTNKGDGSFKDVFWLLPGLMSAYKFFLYDINNDNLIDLLVEFSSNGEKVSVYYNKGNSTFEQGLEFDGSQITFSDFNNDGLVDLLAEDWDYSKGGYIVLIKFNKGDGTFEDSWFVFNNGVYKISVSDINNDGFADIIVGLRNSTGLGSSIDVKFAVFLNNGDKTFRSPLYYGSGGYAVIEDANNDGFSDIIAYSFGEYVLFNTGHYN